MAIEAAFPARCNTEDRHGPWRYRGKYFDEQEQRKQHDATISVERSLGCFPVVVSLRSTRDKVENIR